MRQTDGQMVECNM